MAKCLECRFHSKEKRRDVTPEGVADGEMELVAWEDEPQDFIMCMHKRDRPREVGFVRRTPEAGDTCADFEPGKKLAYVTPAIASAALTPAMFKTFSAEPVLEDDENDDG